MIRFVVQRVDDPDKLIRLHVKGLSMADYPYQAHEILVVDASMDDMKFTPPDYATPLVGRSAVWNGAQFDVDSAYLKEHVGTVVVLRPVKQPA